MLTKALRRTKQVLEGSRGKVLKTPIQKRSNGLQRIQKARQVIIMRTGSLKERWREPAQKALEILDALKEHGKERHAEEVAAALVRAKGLNCDALRGYFNAIQNITKAKLGGVYGNATTGIIALKGNALEKTLTYLNESHRPLTSTEIARRTKLNQKSVSSALRILELASQVQKMPGVGSEKEVSLQWWPRSKKAPLPVNNNAFRLMFYLRRRKWSLMNLSRELVNSDRSIYRVARAIEKTGLVKIRQTKPDSTAALTRRGKYLLERDLRNGFLSHELRLRIVGLS